MTAIPPDIQAALDKIEPAMRKAFVDAINRITSAAQLQLVVGHILNGDIEAAVNALRIDPRFFGPLDPAIAEAYFNGGVLALAALPRLKDPFPAAEWCSASTEGTTGRKLGSGSGPET